MLATKQRGSLTGCSQYGLGHLANQAQEVARIGQG